eukprot:13955312-Alexandrium_andersonii.AAC.1
MPAQLPRTLLVRLRSTAVSGHDPASCRSQRPSPADEREACVSMSRSAVPPQLQRPHALPGWRSSCERT